MMASISTRDTPAQAGFQWDDPFLLDEQLTEDERLISASARAFTTGKLKPSILRAYAAEEADPDIYIMKPHSNNPSANSTPTNGEKHDSLLSVG